MAEPGSARRGVVAALVGAALALASCRGDDGSPSPTRAADGRACDIHYADGRCERLDAPPRPDRTAPRPRQPQPRPRPRRPRLRLERAAGAKIMTGFRGTFPDAALLGRIRRGEVGGVIVMGENVSARLADATGAMRRAARAGGAPGLLIATDQEGGLVKRLPQSPPSRDAAAMGRAGPTTAEREGAATGRALRRAGINVDLAPVADVQRPGGFMGGRAFGTTAEGASRGACAFASGLADAGIAGTMKHFPGLGRATTNTDEARADVAASREELEADLAPYRACAAASPLVMLSNAVYPNLAEGGRPAVLERAIVTGLLRRELGFDGVTISDTLAAPSVASPTTAVRASRAGVDMLLLIDPALAAAAYRSVLGAARAGDLSRDAVRASAARIRALQRDLGG